MGDTLHLAEAFFVESQKVCSRCLLAKRRRLNPEEYCQLGRKIDRSNSFVEFQIAEGSAVVKKTIPRHGLHEKTMHEAASACMLFERDSTDTLAIRGQLPFQNCVDHTIYWTAEIYRYLQSH